jgi:hypothetical protein
VATKADIDALRLLIAESDDKAPYDDISLSVRLDAAASPEGLAAIIWREKAANYAALVTVSESGSSRSLSDLHKNALAMAKSLSDADPSNPGTGPAVRGVVIRRLTR